MNFKFYVYCLLFLPSFEFDISNCFKFKQHFQSCNTGDVICSERISLYSEQNVVSALKYLCLRMLSPALPADYEKEPYQFQISCSTNKVNKSVDNYTHSVLKSC